MPSDRLQPQPQDQHEPVLIQQKTATAENAIDLALELEELLLSVCYDRDPQITLNTVEAIAGVIRMISIGLPLHVSARAVRLARCIRSNSEESARSIEWAFLQG